MLRLYTNGHKIYWRMIWDLPLVKTWWTGICRGIFPETDIWLTNGKDMRRHRAEGPSLVGLDGRQVIQLWHLTVWVDCYENISYISLQYKNVLMYWNNGIYILFITIWSTAFHVWKWKIRCVKWWQFSWFEQFFKICQILS